MEDNESKENGLWDRPIVNQMGAHPCPRCGTPTVGILSNGMLYCHRCERGLGGVD